MTKQPDSIDAKEEMKMAASTTGAADSFPRFDKFQLLVGEPSSVEYSYVSNCLEFQFDTYLYLVFSSLEPGGLDDPPSWCSGNCHGCGRCQVNIGWVSEEDGCQTQMGWWVGTSFKGLSHKHNQKGEEADMYLQYKGIDKSQLEYMHILN